MDVSLGGSISQIIKRSVPKIKIKRQIDNNVPRRYRRDHLISLNDFVDVFDKDTEGANEKSMDEFDTTDDLIDATVSTEKSLDLTDSSDIDTTTHTFEAKLHLETNFEEYDPVTKRRKSLRRNFKNPSFDWKALLGGNLNGVDSLQSNDSLEEDDSHSNGPNLFSESGSHHSPDFGLKDKSGKFYKKIQSNDLIYGSGGNLYDPNKWAGSHFGSKSWEKSLKHFDSQNGGESHTNSYGKWDGARSEQANSGDDVIYYTGSETRRGSRSDFDDIIKDRGLHTHHKWKVSHSDAKNERTSHSEPTQGKLNLKEPTSCHDNNTGGNTPEYDKQNFRKTNLAGTHSGRQSTGSGINKYVQDNNNDTRVHIKKKQKLSLITFEKVTTHNNINNNNNANGAVNYNDITNGGGNMKTEQNNCFFVLCVGLYLNPSKFGPFGPLPKYRAGKSTTQKPGL